MLLGPPDLGYDLISMVVFRDEAHCKAFWTCLGEGQAAMAYEEDLKGCTEDGSMRVVGVLGAEGVRTDWGGWEKSWVSAEHVGGGEEAVSPDCTT